MPLRQHPVIVIQGLNVMFRLRLPGPQQKPVAPHTNRGGGGVHEDAHADAARGVDDVLRAAYVYARGTREERGVPFVEADVRCCVEYGDSAIRR